MLKQLLEKITNKFISKTPNSTALIQSYESQMKELQNENEKLKKEKETYLKKLKSRNRKLKELETRINEMTLQSQKISTEIPVVNHEKPATPLELFNKLLLEEKFDECGIAVNKFIQKANPKEYSLEGLRRVAEFLNKVYQIDPIDSMKMEVLYMASLNMMKLFFQKEPIKEFFSKNEKRISIRFLHSNHSHLIIDLIDFYFNQYEIKLAALFTELLKTKRISYAEIDFSRFVKLLWYSFYVEKDDQLILDSGIHLLVEKYSHFPEIQLYKLYQQIKNQSVNLESNRALITNLKGKGSVFNKNEKIKIYQLLDEKLAFFTEKPKPKPMTISDKGIALRKMAFVTKLPTKTFQETSMKLRKDYIQLAVYSDPFLKNQKGYVAVEVLTDTESGRTFILESEIGPLKKKLGSKWLDIRGFDENTSVVKKVSLTNVNSFAWPSTDLKGGYNQNENSGFKEESDLKKLGYQITNMTREKRWKILETAVKQLGLKTVAYTIAQNVKLRKGQSNGEKKFSYAIGEWEYDLHKLKETYYYHDFAWPSTKTK